MCTLVLPREVQKENLGMLESMDAIINLMSTEDNTATEGANKTLSTNNNKTGNETFYETFYWFFSITVHLFVSKT